MLSCFLVSANGSKQRPWLMAGRKPRSAFIYSIHGLERACETSHIWFDKLSISRWPIEVCLVFKLSVAAKLELQSLASHLEYVVIQPYALRKACSRRDFLKCSTCAISC